MGDLLELDRGGSPRRRRVPAASARRSATRFLSRSRTPRTVAEPGAVEQDYGGKDYGTSPQRRRGDSAGLCARIDGVTKTIDWPPARRRRAGRGRLCPARALAAVVLGGGHGAVVLRRRAVVRLARLRRRLLDDAERFRRRPSRRSPSSPSLVLYGAFLALKPARLGELTGGPILINGQPIKLPVEPVLRLIALGRRARRRGRSRGSG